MIEGYAERDTSVHLRFGIEYHKALEEYDDFKLAGRSHEDSVRGVVGSLLIRIRDWDPDITTKAGNYKNPRSLVQLVVDYLDKYQDDPAKTVIRENGEPATELSFRFELDWGPQGNSVQEFEHGAQPYVLCGHLDRVVDYSGNLLVMDRKTTTTTPGSYYMNQYSPNNQMTLYTLAGQIVMHAAVKGVVIDAAQVLIEKPNNYVRGFTYRTEAQLTEWMGDLRFWFQQAETYATVGYWPMNDTACDKFGGCRFREVCSKDPSVRENFLKADFTKLPLEERWNPLKPR
jgi:hypothetical protein